MATATTTGAFLAALKTTMAARMAGASGLEQVTVTLAPPAPEEQPAGDLLYLVRAAVRTADRVATANMSRRRDEDVIVPGRVQGYAVSRTGGDDAFQAAFDRAEAILEQLIEQLRDAPPQVGQQTRSAIVRAITWTPIAVDKGGWIVVGDYDLHYTSRVP